MANSVSNDALWEKLSEISEQLSTLSAGQKSTVQSKEETENMPDLSGIKDEIITEMKTDIQIFGLSNDSHFAANTKNIEMLNKNIDTVLNIVSRIRKQQRETTELQSENDTEQRLEALETQVKGSREYLNFRFFKLRKTSVVITLLGLLVFILTLFCMKQQNDYSLLINGYHNMVQQFR